MKLRNNHRLGFVTRSSGHFRPLNKRRSKTPAKAKTKTRALIKQFLRDHPGAWEKDGYFHSPLVYGWKGDPNGTMRWEAFGPLYQFATR